MLEKKRIQKRKYKTVKYKIKKMINNENTMLILKCVKNT